MNLNEIERDAVAYNSQCAVDCRNNLLKVAISLNQSPTQNRLKIIEKFVNEYNLDKQKVIQILGLYIKILRLFNNLSDDEFNRRLLELGFPNEFVEDLPLISNREKLTEAVVNSGRESSLSLVSLKWRIDISLGNSVLIKKVPVSVILCLQLGNRKKYTINVDIRTFHKLRYTLATIMKEYSTLIK